MTRQTFLRASARLGTGLGFSALLAACSSGSAPAAPTAAPAAPTSAAAATSAPAATTAPQTAGKVTLRYTYDNTPGEKDLAAQVQRDYAKMQPGVTLQPEIVVDNWDQKTIAELVAGTAPDILLGYGSTFSAFASKGAFLDITEMIKGWDSTYNVDDLYPVAMQELQIKGKQYGIPYCFDPVSVFFYMKPTLDAANVAYPNDKWTYDDMQKDFVALTKKDSSGKVVQWGFNGAECIADWGYVRMYPAIWAYGGDKYNADMTKCLLDSPEALQAMTMFYNLKFKENTAPTTGDIGKLSYYQMFASGQCAMQTTGPWAISTYHDMIQDAKFKDQWDVGHSPNGPKGRFMYAAGNDWGLNKAGKNLKQAEQLLQYLTGPDVSKEVGSIGRRVPARKSAGNAFVVANSKPASQSVFPDSLQYARFEQLHPTQEAKISQILTTAWGNVILTNKGTPEQIIPDAVKQVNQLLSQG
jgi:multiple sugar transport system substrate-binding protein